MLLALSLALVDPLAPAVITVQGGCALPQAIRSANSDMANAGCPAGSGADTIVLTADVTLFAVEEVDDGDNGLPTVTSEITIEGNGHTIERSDTAPSDFRILKVESSGDLTLKNTTVSGGRATESGFPSGGAFLNFGTLRLERSAVVSNLAYVNGGAVDNRTGSSLFSYDSSFVANLAAQSGIPSKGGAIFSWGYLRAERTLFENNFVGAVGAFAYTGAGGAIWANGPTVILDSTFTGNNVLATLSASGWAISLFSSPDQRTLLNSTVSGNGTISTPLPGSTIAGYGSLTHVTLSGNRGFALDGDFEATATLIANNSDGANCSASTTITGVNNIADDASCPGVPSNLTGLDSMLEDNGGPTPTHALLAGSNAIEAAGFCNVDADQRGAPRVGACDSGAFEFMGCPVLTLADDTVDDVQISEECAIAAGPNFSVIGPAGDLTLLFGEFAEFADGFSVAADGRLTVGHDPSLMLVLDELIEADRARRRAVVGQDDGGGP